MRVPWVFAGGPLVLAGCFGTPTPLAPGIDGSVGVPHHGVQTNAVELPVDGPGFTRFRRHGTAYWGNPRLVRMLEEAAKAVSETRPGPPLVLGDLSAKAGGRIPRHQSHRTGRDVDLLWYVKTATGAPVKSPGFIRVGADGLAPVAGTSEYLQLDLERQWLLVRELLTSPYAGVQWLFCSEEIEALLIDYARARDEPPAVVWKAETVLIQPADSLPHDDHLHLRIACSPEEAVAGCEGGGPRWEWLSPLPRLDGDAFIDEIAHEDPLLESFDELEHQAEAEAPSRG